MADRLTRVVGGNGSATQSFELDPGLLQYVQSVFVTIDNSGGGAISPTLTVQTNNGVAIAKKQQGRSIPAGGSGSATWALRLDDEQAAGTAAATYGACIRNSAFQTLADGALTLLTANTTVWDTDTMANTAGGQSFLTIKHAGLYAGYTEVTLDAPGAAGEWMIGSQTNPLSFMDFSFDKRMVTNDGLTWQAGASWVRQFTVGVTVQAVARQRTGFANDARLNMLALQYVRA